MTSPSTSLTATPAASSGTASTMGCSPNGYLMANNKTNTAGSDSSTAAAGNATSSAIGNFGSCTPPQIQFGVGFDGRKETAFEPVDKSRLTLPGSYPFC